MLPAYLLIGATAGLIVSSWQGFKDPPWEGFFLSKFLRSILVGSGAAFALYVADLRGATVVDNLGVMAFAIVAIERVAGEAYKGFLRRGAHPEYYKLLRRLSEEAQARDGRRAARGQRPGCGGDWAVELASPSGRVPQPSHRL
jgi:hypothetical protein